MIGEIIVYLIAFFGVYLAGVLKRIDKDEVRSGSNYISFFNLLTVAGIVAVILFHSSFNWITPFLMFIGGLIGYFFYYPYFYLGLSLVASVLVGKELLLINSTIVFLFGVTYLKKLNNELLYYILPLVLILVSFGLRDYVGYITPFVVGTLVSLILFNKLK